MTKIGVVRSLPIDLTSLDADLLYEHELACFNHEGIQISVTEKGGHIQCYRNGVYLMGKTYKTDKGFINGLEKVKELIKL